MRKEIIRSLANWCMSEEKGTICKFLVCLFKMDCRMFSNIITILKFKLHFIEIFKLFKNVNKVTIKNL